MSLFPWRRVSKCMRPCALPSPGVWNYWHMKGMFIHGGDESADVSVICDDNLIELLAYWGDKKKRGGGETLLIQTPMLGLSTRDGAPIASVSVILSLQVTPRCHHSHLMNCESSQLCISISSTSLIHHKHFNLRAFQSLKVYFFYIYTQLRTGLVVHVITSCSVRVFRNSPFAGGVSLILLCFNSWCAACESILP